MILWFLGGSVVVVWAVFHDPAFDYRLLLLGALLPELVDVPLGGARYAHTVLASALLLTGVMLLTRRRRRLRRRLLALPVGTFVHLLLDAAWTRKELFWWPAFGVSLDGQPLPSLDHGLAVLLLQEALGVLALVWAWRRFRLDQPARRSSFLHTGHLGRDLLR